MIAMQRFPLNSPGMENSEALIDDKMFEDLEKSIYKLIEEDNSEESLSVVQQKEECRPMVDLKEQKKNYNLTSNAKTTETKNRLLVSYLVALNDEIAITSEKLLLYLRTVEFLKSQLQKHAADEFSAWDRQLYINQVSKYLSKPNTSLGNRVDLPWHQSVEATESFIQNPNTKFEAYASATKAIMNIMGNVSSENILLSSPGLHNSALPKFILGCGGGNNNNKGEFCRPWGVCTDPTGRILVCDRSNHRVQIFNEYGEFLHQFGREGSRPGEFNRPTGIASDDKCRIVVTDKDNHRIQIFSFSGNFLFTFGCQGTEPGQFNYPWDVAVAKGRIAVSDSKNHRIQLFDETGRFLSEVNAQRMGILGPRLSLKYLDSPRGLSFLSDGSLLATDFNNHNILLINSSFNHVKWFGAEGVKPGEFFRPQGIAFDGFGKFAVADSKNYRIQVFDLEGNCIKTFGARGSNPGQFNCPQGICFHQNQNIIVVDLENNRVQVF